MVEILVNLGMRELEGESGAIGPGSGCPVAQVRGHAPAASIEHPGAGGPAGCLLLQLSGEPTLRGHDGR